MIKKKAFKDFSNNQAHWPALIYETFNMEEQNLIRNAFIYPRPKNFSAYPIWHNKMIISRLSSLSQPETVCLTCLSADSYVKEPLKLLSRKNLQFFAFIKKNTAVKETFH